MEFCIDQYKDDGQQIYKLFHILRMKFYRPDFFWCNILLGYVCDIFLYKSCAHSLACTERKTSQFSLWEYFSSTKLQTGDVKPTYEVK